MRKLFGILAIAAVVVMLLPAGAKADTINGSATILALSQCNTVGLCNAGTISVTPYLDGATNELRVTVTMNAGFGLFGNGNGNGAIGWNGTGLSTSTDDISLASFSDSGGGTFDGFGSFADSLDGPAASGAVGSLTFDIVCTGACTASNISGFAAHVINTSTGLTGFDATGGVPPPSVPEPTTLTMLGAGLLGLVGLARRKLNA